MNSIISEEGIKSGLSFLKRKDPVMKNIINEIGDFTLHPRSNNLESIIRIVIGQQLSVSSARAIFHRLRNKFIGEITPHAISQTQDLVFFEVGLSKFKTETIRRIAHEIAIDNLNLQTISEMNNEEISQILIKIKGIGSWTIQNYLIFVLGRMNIVPINDLAFRKAIKLNYRFIELPTDKEIHTISRKWIGFETIAAWYLWETINRKIVK